MSERSDVNIRKPMFDLAMEQVESARKAGGFEEIDPEVTEAVLNSVPVGLDTYGNVILPRGYGASDGLPVLMARRGGAKFNMLQAFYTQAQVAGIDIMTLDLGETVFDDEVNDQDASTWSELVPYVDETGIRQKVVPIVVGISETGIYDGHAAYMLQHEGGHYVDNKRRSYQKCTSIDQIGADAEKFAYREGLRGMRNLGVPFGRNEPEKLATELAGLPFDEVMRYLPERLKLMHGRLGQTIVANTVELLYGDGSDTATKLEIEAFMYQRIITPQPAPTIRLRP